MAAQIDLTVAEALAIVFGLTVVREMGFLMLLVDSNSENLVQALILKELDGSSLSFMVVDVISLLVNFVSIVFSHIPKSCNNVAHSLAMFECPNESELLRMEHVPIQFSLQFILM